jgi:hypothetical protein
VSKEIEKTLSNLLFFGKKTAEDLDLKIEGLATYKSEITI